LSDIVAVKMIGLKEQPPTENETSHRAPLRDSSFSSQIPMFAFTLFTPVGKLKKTTLAEPK